MCVCASVSGKTFLYALSCAGLHCVWLPLPRLSSQHGNGQTKCVYLANGKVQAYLTLIYIHTLTHTHTHTDKLLQMRVCVYVSTRWTPETLKCRCCTENKAWLLTSLPCYRSLIKPDRIYVTCNAIQLCKHVRVLPLLRNASFMTQNKLNLQIFKSLGLVCFFCLWKESLMLIKTVLNIF